MTFQFTPAVRENVSVLVSISGSAGSGKTYSALRLAQGISPSGRIAFIDTEARRGLHYSDKFKFLHADMRPPFEPKRFVEGIHAAEAAGAEVVILDSFSHEYDGEGGIMDWADRLAESGVKSPGNWKEPKFAHKKMMNALLQCRASLIFCLRADEKIEIIREGGRTQVRPLGWTPIAEKRFLYECTVSLTLAPTSPGRTDYSLPHKIQEQHRPFFPDGELITEASGRALAEWARGGSAPPADGQVDAELAETADMRAEAGTAAYAAFWSDLSKPERTALLPAHEARKARAAQVDAEREQDPP